MGDKAPPTIHHAQVIRADLDLLADLTADAWRSAFLRRHQRRARAKRTPAEPLGTASFLSAGRRSRPGRGRAEGQGRAIPCSAAGAGLALLDAFLRRDPPAAGALRSRLALKSAAASAKILRLNADEGALRDLRFAVGDRARARGEPFVAVARSRRPAAQPRPRPDRRGGGAARPRSAGPERPRIEPEGLRRGGRSGLGSRQGRRPGVLRLPGRPSGRSRNPRALGVRPRHRHPAALAAARAADRDENSGPDLRRRTAVDGRDRASQPGRTPPRARSRSPPPPPSTSPPIFPAARRPCSPSRPNCARNRRPKSSTCCSPKIASRPPKRRARRR